jgi:outer membrane protein
MDTKYFSHFNIAALAANALLAVSTVDAYEAGDWVLRAGPAGVLVTGESNLIPELAVDGKVEAKDAWSLGLTGTYMVTRNIGIGLLAAWPFKHDIEATHDLSAYGTVAEVKQLPPTLTLQYHFDTASRLNPYVGVGVNYTYFFDEETRGALKSQDLEVDDSWGWAGEIGLDYDLGNDWLISAQAWYFKLETTATVKGITSFNLDINPWIVMLGVGKRF